MTRVLCWFGPVSRQQIGASVPPLYQLEVQGCTGDGSDGKARCGEHAAAWRDASGRTVPGMRRRFKLGAEAPLIVAAFSAGGQIVKRLCVSAEDRAELRAVYLADATYTTEWREKGERAGLDPVTAALVDYAALAYREGRPFVATSSNGANKTYPTGAQTLEAIRLAVEERLGRPFEDAASDPMLAGLRPPLRAGRLGSLLFVDFGGQYKHGEHPTVIAPVVLPRMLAQLDASPTPARDTSSSRPTIRPWMWWGGAIVAAAALLWLRR